MSLRMHLDQTLQQAGHQLAGKYAESIHEYDLGHEHILSLADLISTGVISQFAEKF